MLKQILSLAVLCAALSACSNNKDGPVVNGPYGYNSGYTVGGQNLCPPQVAVDWNRLVASRCNLGSNPNQDQANRCIWGAKQFQVSYPNINCDIAVADLQWCPGNDWRSQKFFTINNPIIQSVYDKYGWAAVTGQPDNNGGYYGGSNGGWSPPQGY